MPPHHVGVVGPLYAHRRPGDLLQVPSVPDGDGLARPVLHGGLHVGGEERPLPGRTLGATAGAAGGAAAATHAAVLSPLVGRQGQHVAASHLQGRAVSLWGT